MIDTLILEGDLSLRAQLHELLQVEQSRLFTFVQSPTNFQLTWEGKSRLQQDRVQQAKKEAVTKGKSEHHMDQGCVLY